MFQRKFQKRSKTVDEKYVGLEPAENSSLSRIDLILAYNYYNYHYDVKSAMSWLADYIEVSYCQMMKKNGSQSEYKRLNVASNGGKILYHRLNQYLMIPIIKFWHIVKPYLMNFIILITKLENLVFMSILLLSR